VEETRSVPTWAAMLSEVVFGVIVGALVGVPLAFLLGAVVPSRGGGFDDVIAALGGLYFGFIAGVTIGVSLIGRIMKHGGVWWAALIGAVVGAVITVVLGFSGMMVRYPQLLNILYGLMTALGGTIGYSISARRRAKAG
jgi:hypothetical protein